MLVNVELPEFNPNLFKGLHCECGHEFVAYLRDTHIFLCPKCIHPETYDLFLATIQEVAYFHQMFVQQAKQLDELNAKLDAVLDTWKRKLKKGTKHDHSG